MKPKASIFDVDGTLVSGFYIVKFPEALYQEGLFSKRELQTIRELFEEYKGGSDKSYEQFTWDVINAFGRGVKGRKREDIEKRAERYIQLHPEEKFPFTDGLIKMVRGKGYRTIVISGSPYEIIHPFSKSLAIDKAFATTYETDNGVFTGEVIQNCAINSTKRIVVQRYFQDNDIDSYASTAFGDNHHDLAFLEIVGHPVAIKPNKQLEEVAVRNSWLICKDEENVLDSVKSYLP